MTCVIFVLQRIHTKEKSRVNLRKSSTTITTPEVACHVTKGREFVSCGGPTVETTYFSTIHKRPTQLPKS